MMEQKAQMISLAKRIGDMGLTTSSGGNISARLPDGKIVITPNKHHRSFSDLGVEDLSVVDSKSELLEGPKPSVELPMHMAIYSAAPSVSWIVHAHPPMAIAYATENMLPDTAVVEMSELRMSHVGREAPGSKALANAVASAVAKGSNGIFLEAHGVVVVASGANEAYLLLEEIENECKADLARRLIRMSEGR